MIWIQKLDRGNGSERSIPCTRLVIVGCLLIGGLCAGWRASSGSGSHTIRTDDNTSGQGLPLRPGLDPNQNLTLTLTPTNLAQALLAYSELTGRMLIPCTNTALERVDDAFGKRFSRWHWIQRSPLPDSGIRYHADGLLRAREVKESLEVMFHTNGWYPKTAGKGGFQLLGSPARERKKNEGWIRQQQPVAKRSSNIQPSSATGKQCLLRCYL